MDASSDKLKSFLFDLGHPAHVHYFKWHIQRLLSEGHKITVVARDKDVAHELLTAYGIDFIDRGTGSDTILGKLAYLVRHIWRHVAQVYGCHDVYVGYASFYVAIAAFLLGKKSIILDDTESGYIQRWLYLPFAYKIVVPKVFSAWVPESKTIRLEGVFEELYMVDLKDPEKTGKAEKTCLLRLVKWTANHDVGLSGISDKTSVINLLKDQGYRIFVSSESGSYPEGTELYSQAPEDFHHFISNCSLYVGESATVASEACAAGVYSIYFDQHGRGYTNYWADCGRLSWFQDFEEKSFIQALQEAGKFSTDSIKISSSTIVRNQLTEVFDL